MNVAAKVSRRHVPLRIYLGVLFGIAMFAIGLTIAGMFYARMRGAIVANSSAVFDNTANLVAHELRFNRNEIAVSLKLAAETQLASATTFDQRMRNLHVLGTILESNRLAQAAYVGYADGSFFMLRRLPEVGEAKPPARAAFVVRAASPSAPGRIIYFDPNMRRLAERTDPKYRFDPRTRPWFGVRSGDVDETAPYVFFTTQQLGVTFSVRAAQGSVFGADIVLGALSDQLASLRPTPSSVAAIAEDDGNVIAFTDAKALFALSRQNGKPARLPALAAPPLLAAYAAALPAGMRAEGLYRDAKRRLWRYRATPMETGADADNVLLLAVPEDEMTAVADQVRREALLVGLGILIAALPLAIWLAQLVARPIRRLHDDAVALRSLDFSDRAATPSVITEIAEFSDTFDAMRRHVRDYNQASTRFVPREFVEILGRKDIQSLQLGDHVERTMTILFSDIRSFTTLSGSMTPQQTFNFVNSYLTRIGPIIRQHRGFIDKYIGDAIMALFPENSRTAVEAAIAMQRRVVTYNQERARAGYEPVAIGIGIHRGNLMLGTIGETQRFETTVIADAVNIASRLESLTKTFHVLILTSGDVVDDIEKGVCSPRRLCDVQVKGATHPVTLYEICDADPPDLHAHKVRTLDEFAAGRLAYAQGHFVDAFRAFDEISEREPRDLPAAYFRDRAWDLSRTADLVWDGIERMETK